MTEPGHTSVLTEEGLLELQRMSRERHKNAKPQIHKPKPQPRKRNIKPTPRPKRPRPVPVVAAPKEKVNRVDFEKLREFLKKHY